MPRPEGATPRASGMGEQGRITLAAQFTNKGGVQLWSASKPAILSLLNQYDFAAEVVLPYCIKL